MMYKFWCRVVLEKQLYVLEMFWNLFLKFEWPPHSGQAGGIRLILRKFDPYFAPSKWVAWIQQNLWFAYILEKSAKTAIIFAIAYMNGPKLILFPLFCLINHGTPWKYPHFAHFVRKNGQKMGGNRNFSIFFRLFPCKMLTIKWKYTRYLRIHSVIVPAFGILKKILQKYGSSSYQNNQGI